MNDYSIALFLHIAGTLMFFVALGLEWTGLKQIGSAASPELVRAWMRISKSTRGIGIASMLAILISGFYMTARVWGFRGWIIVTLGALVLGVVLSLALTGPRMKAVGQAMAAQGKPGTPGIQSLANHPLLWISIQVRVAIALGIILLKIAKPDLGGSLLTIGVAILVGITAAYPAFRPAANKLQQTAR